MTSPAPLILPFRLVLANGMNRLYSFVSEFLTKRSFSDGDTNESRATLLLCAQCCKAFAAHGEARHGSRDDRQTAISALHVLPLLGIPQTRHGTAKNKPLIRHGHALPCLRILGDEDLKPPTPLRFRINAKARCQEGFESGGP